MGRTATPHPEHPSAGPERTRELVQWIERNNGRWAWSVPTANGSRVTCYLVRGCPLIVLFHAGDCGWELFHPASASGRVADTLAAADLFLLKYTTKPLANEMTG